MDTLETARMRLVPATAELVRLEIEDRAGFGRTLRTSVPEDWPPETIRDATPWFLSQLTADAGLAGWLCWYGIVRGGATQPDALAASGGFLGPPTDGAVEIGYSVLPGWQRQGLATEMAAAMTAWALRQPGVERVRAEADAANTPSVRLLRRLGFTELGPGSEPGHRLFEQRGSD